ncbi:MULTISPECIES: hexameric tyrosine-coordinated heme protein [unclassified Meridianimarinicoccus]|uniref:hexameric tyrosine-coordinated heme protein n=1 Tax=unclassified Meridianimarinicoccus TaxID=2923344 RepID=UPI001865BB5F|nr:hexameric tyrosine-coordinated heme protein [Fluviibacterium sp. MJW13]
MTDQPAPTDTTSWLPSLRTDTPEAGFQLAITMARRAVKATQPDMDTLKKLRPAYAGDSDSLIQASGVVANYFATVAAANDYWKS